MKCFYKRYAFFSWKDPRTVLNFFIKRILLQYLKVISQIQDLSYERMSLFWLFSLHANEVEIRHPWKFLKCLSKCIYQVAYKLLFLMNTDRKQDLSKYQLLRNMICNFVSLLQNKVWWVFKLLVMAGHKYLVTL